MVELEHPAEPAVADNWDAVLETYADHYFEYNPSSRSVTKSVSSVCASCPGGGATSDVFAYTSHTPWTSGDYNAWTNKAVQTLPDGSEIIVYSNFAGLTMLYVNQDPTGNQWITFYRYNDSGAVMWIAHPSAVNGFDDSYDDLLDYDSMTGLYTFLNDSTGLIEVINYFTFSGDVGALGYVSDRNVRQGQSGSDITVSSYTYTSNTDSNGNTVYLVATELKYPVSGSLTPAITTTYSPSFYSGTNQLSSMKTADGKRSRPHLFRIVLSCSRKAYSEVVTRQTTEAFLRCIENALCHFGGVPKTLVIDNLKAAVTKADWYDPELHPKIQEFARHYGTVVLPTRPYTPRHKGKVERGVGYAQSNALKGRTFASLAEQNQFLAEWESTVADTRIHGTTRKQVSKLFEELEKPALLPLPPARFPCFQEAQRIVNRDGHVEVAKAYYSAPPEFVGRDVWARWDGHVVRLFDQKFKQIAIHAKKEPGRFATDSRHIVAEKRGGIERGTAWWLQKAHAIGPHAGQWADSTLHVRGIHAVRTVIGLVSLTHRHPVLSIEAAAQVAQSHGAHRLRDIRNLLKRSEPPVEQQQFEFVAEHPLIRPLADYSRLVQVAFDNTPVNANANPWIATSTKENDL